jgi:hypothetical protein
MKKFMKIVVFCAALMIGGMIFTPKASANTDISPEMIMKPMFTYINAFNNGFDITDGGEVSILCYLSFRNADEGKISVFLEKYSGGNWVLVKDWAISSPADYANLLTTEYVSSGAQYRMRSFGYVFVGGKMVEASSYTSSPIWY